VRCFKSELVPCCPEATLETNGCYGELKEEVLNDLDFPKQPYRSMVATVLMVVHHLRDCRFQKLTITTIVCVKRRMFEVHKQVVSIRRHCRGDRAVFLYTEIRSGTEPRVEVRPCQRRYPSQAIFKSSLQRPWNVACNPVMIFDAPVLQNRSKTAVCIRITALQPTAVR
jgi:hypothetical protein